MFGVYVHEASIRVKAYGIKFNACLFLIATVHSPGHALLGECCVSHAEIATGVQTFPICDDLLDLEFV